METAVFDLIKTTNVPKSEDKMYKLLQVWFERFRSVGEMKTGGVTRLAYSYEEDEMHRILADIAYELGFYVENDGVGNTYISLEKIPTSNCLLIGSHLDSVPNGGRFDGFLGVIAGLQVLQRMKEDDLNLPVKVAAFRCEESSAFGRATIGSGLITGKVREEDLYQLKNKKGENLYSVLRSRGLLNGDYSISSLKGYLEIHIEQGRVLYDKNIGLGIVTSIAAPTRFKLTIHGRQDHSGATPMSMRKDAVSAASEIILETERLGRMESIHSTVATVGEVKVIPNALNVVPGNVELGIDIRGIESTSIASVVSGLKEKIERITNERGLTYELVMTSSSEPVKLDHEVIGGLRKSAKKLGVNYIEMPSGAGHDAMEFADIAPTGMLFIPCEEGISHNPHEMADLKQLNKACELMYDYIKEVYA